MSERVLRAMDRLSVFFMLTGVTLGVVAAACAIFGLLDAAAFVGKCAAVAFVCVIGVGIVASFLNPSPDPWP